MTITGVSRSLAAGLAVFFTVAILFSSRAVFAAGKPLQLENRESQAAPIVIDPEKWAGDHGASIETKDKDYPHVNE